MCHHALHAFFFGLTNLVSLVKWVFLKNIYLGTWTSRLREANWKARSRSASSWAPCGQEEEECLSTGTELVSRDGNWSPGEMIATRADQIPRPFHLRYLTRVSSNVLLPPSLSERGVLVFPAPTCDPWVTWLFISSALRNILPQQLGCLYIQMDFDISISVLVFFRLVFAVSPFILNSRYPFFFFFWSCGGGRRLTAGLGFANTDWDPPFLIAQFTSMFLLHRGDSPNKTSLC